MRLHYLSQPNIPLLPRHSSLPHARPQVLSRMYIAAFNPRIKSLARGNTFVFVSVALAALLSHAPRIQPTLWIILPLLGTLIGTADTLRCIQRRWSFYHGGVLLCLYMDLMAITLVAFLLLYPYFVWFSSTH